MKRERTKRDLGPFAIVKAKRKGMVVSATPIEKKKSKGIPVKPYKPVHKEKIAETPKAIKLKPIAALMKKHLNRQFNQQ